jgi:hypothetical protein
MNRLFDFLSVNAVRERMLSRLRVALPGLSAPFKGQILCELREKISANSNARAEDKPHPAAEEYLGIVKRDLMIARSHEKSIRGKGVTAAWHYRSDLWLK